MHLSDERVNILEDTLTFHVQQADEFTPHYSCIQFHSIFTKIIDFFYRIKFK